MGLIVDGLIACETVWGPDVLDNSPDDAGAVWPAEADRKIPALCP
jgi:hypothetical protein